MKQAAQKKHPVRRALCIALGVLLLYSALSMTATAVVLRVMFRRRVENSPLQYTYEELASACPRERFTFLSGSSMLYGWRYDAEDPRGLIVVVNGIGADADRHLSEIAAFTEAGWSVATWDATGVGSSEGGWIVGIQQIADDLAAFLKYRARTDAWEGLPVVLYGHSAGAYAAAVNLAAHDEIRAAVCISGLDRPVTLMYDHAEKRFGVFAAAQYPFLYLENVFLFGADANASAREAIAAANVPVLIVGGDSDDLVPYEDSLIRDPEQYENPCVQSIEITSAFRNEHSTPWLSAAAARYRLEFKDGDAADKALANELDPEFIETVLGFFADAIG